jgi:hypothetical protein
LLGNEHSERSADRAADESQLEPGLGEAIDVGVVASPRRILMCATRGAQRADHVTVRVEDADLGHGAAVRPFCLRASRSRFSGVNADGAE